MAASMGPGCTSRVYLLPLAPPLPVDHRSTRAVRTRAARWRGDNSSAKQRVVGVAQEATS
eukprot:scaffold71334_cov28-Tisochrysis_lutea.AAC.2